MSKLVFLYENITLAELKIEYVPFPDPGPPRTKKVSAAFGGLTFASVSFSLS